MPAISKIRFANVIFEDGQKRYNDEIFRFDGQNGAILLENGGGKTVFIQTALQAVLPHADLAGRKLKDTLKLDEGPAHVAIEWLLHDNPRHYAVTAVTLYIQDNNLKSVRFSYDYNEGDRYGLEELPFSKETSNGTRAANRHDMQDYYSYVAQSYPSRGKVSPTIEKFRQHIEDQYHIISSEWESVIKINSTEGGVEDFFNECKTTQALFDRLLIPAVERVMNQESFVETFDSYREGFKEYKRFKEMIGEKEKIIDELEMYVNTYEELDNVNKSMENQKSWMKAVHVNTEAELAHNAKNLKGNEDQMQQWETDKYAHDKKTASFKIGVLAEEHEGLKELATEKREETAALMDNKETFEKEYESLKLAKKKMELEEAEAKFGTAGKQLEEAEKDDDLAGVSDQLNDVKGQLKQMFTHKEERLKKKKKDLDMELNGLKSGLSELKTEAENFGRAHHEKTAEKGELKGQIKTHIYNLQKLEKDIFTNKESETVQNLLDEWQQERRDLESDIITLKEEITALDTEEDHINYRLPLLRKDISELEKDSASAENDLAYLENAQLRVIENLADKKDKWRHIRSVYDKSASLTNQIETEVIKAERNKNETLLKERVASRLADDYSEQDLFYADPVTGKLLETWKNQFPVLETGYSYLNQIGQEISDATTLFPFWALSLITADKEKERLERKLANIKDRLLFPVYVLTTDEAKRLASEKTNPEGNAGAEQPDKQLTGTGGETVVLPDHWTLSGNKEQFRLWQDEITGAAHSATDKRIEAETTLSGWTSIQKQLTEFLTDYPAERYQELRETINETSAALSESRREETKLNSRLDEIRKERTENSEKIVLKNEEANYLEQRIKNANIYKDTERRKIELEQQLAELEEVLERLNKRLKSVEAKQNLFMEDIDYKKDEINRAGSELSIEVYENELYKEVKEAAEVRAVHSEPYLKEQLADLKRREAHLSKALETVKVEYSTAEEAIRRIKQEISQLRSEYDNLDENVVFPYNGEARLVELLEQKKEYEQRFKQADKELRKRHNNEEKALWKLEQERQTFEEFYDAEPETFTKHFEVIGEELEAGKAVLSKRFEALNGEKKRLEKQHTTLDAQLRTLDKYDARYKYTDPDLKTAVLPEDVVMQMDYKRESFVKNGIAVLHKIEEEFDREKNNVASAAGRFKDFCRQEVRDIRLRERAIDGVEHQKTFDEVRVFQQNMNHTLSQAIKIEKGYMRQHDEQFEQFITHIHVHLRKLAEELQAIPKKTQVKTDDQWKQIYTITIPDWSKEEGEERIRQHVDWVLEELDKDAFKDETGQEDTAKIRKNLETWLHSKQLLRRVVNEKSIRVKCRKVSNTNHISSRSFTWEESNKWSGGEKWSKNMTLFLGLLNYVAEKQQHIIPNMTRHRSVILDNPFGKASSDHVLNPVFFIAEKLGFQIIALTAHTEGKFLREYFPVLYSCRLRGTNVSDTQLMTKDKWIHHAYFQDHDPMALARLGEVEQTSLF